MIQGEDGQVQISIEQDGCARISILRRAGYLGTITFERHVLRLDGAVQDDSPWLGSSQRYRTSASFAGQTLRVDARTPDGSLLTMIYSMTPDRDLSEESLVDGRTNGPMVAKRQN